MPAIFYYGYGTQSHKRTARKAIKGERRRDKRNVEAGLFPL